MSWWWPPDGPAQQLSGGAATNANAGNAAGTGAAYTASVNVQPNAGLASGTGTAYDATVSTSTAALPQFRVVMVG